MTRPAPAGPMIGGVLARGGAPDAHVVARRMMDACTPPVTVDLDLGSVCVFSGMGADGIGAEDGLCLVADVDDGTAGEGGRGVDPGLTTAARLASRYARDGVEFVRGLRGGWAVAVWDARRRALLLAVDPFGIRRLYYVATEAYVAFASRPRALLAVPGVPGRVDPTQVYVYLNFGYVPSPRSIFQGVERVAPGHRVVVSDGSLAVNSYRDIVYDEHPTSVADAASAMFRLSEAAVAEVAQGVPAKELGAFLSGGTDSSTVVGLLTRVTGERVNAFSIGFDERRYDELHYAKVAARHFGAAHYTRTVTARDTLALLPRLVDAYEEPFGNNSVIGTWFCAELARETGVSCLLAGDGGDEIFGGNERYRHDRIFDLYQRVPALLRRGVLEPLLLGVPTLPGPFGRAQRYIRRSNIPNPRRFYSWEFFFAGPGAAFLAPDFHHVVDVDAPWAVAQSHWDRVQAADLNRLLYLDLKLAIGDNDLLKVTRTAEMAGVHVRFPFLEPSLVDFTATLPPSFKVRGLEKRYLFKRAFRTLLPAEVLRKQKHGFGVPTSVWLRDDRPFREMARDTLLSTPARQRGYFRPGALETLFDLHDSDPSAYYGDILWTVLMLELWHRRHVEDVGR